jgi:hypothetical protein
VGLGGVEWYVVVGCIAVWLGSVRLGVVRCGSVRCGAVRHRRLTGVRDYGRSSGVVWFGVGCGVGLYGGVGVRNGVRCAERCAVRSQRDRCTCYFRFIASIAAVGMAVARRSVFSRFAPLGESAFHPSMVHHHTTHTVFAAKVKNSYAKFPTRAVSPMG